LHEYLEAKHIYQNINPSPSNWFGPLDAEANS
jgi:hypothetical protein